MSNFLWNVGFCLDGFLGIMFQDITTLLLNHKAFKDTVDIFVDRYRDMGISVVAGIVSLSLYFVLHGCYFNSNWYWGLSFSSEV